MTATTEGITEVREYAGPGYVVIARSPRQARRLIRMAERRAAAEYRKVGEPVPWWRR